MANKYHYPHTERWVKAKTKAKKTAIEGTITLAAALRHDDANPTKSKSKQAARRRVNNMLADNSIAKTGRVELAEKLRKEAKKK